MAADPKGKRSRKVTYAYLHKLAAAVQLIAFVVIILAGIMGKSSVTSVVVRSFVVLVVVSLVTRVITRILASYEEMNSGKA